MKKNETEVKLKVENPRRMRALLRSLGASALHPRRFEDNLVLDFPDLRILRRRCVLRLRFSGKTASLTYKGPPRAGREVKSRVEFETVIEDGPGFLALLFRLGFRCYFRYQKYRTPFDKAPLLISLDETPIGNYLELEGPRRGIDAMARNLGFRRADYITKTYFDLFNEYRKTHRSRNKNMTFGINV